LLACDAKFSEAQELQSLVPLRPVVGVKVQHWMLGSGGGSGCGYGEHYLKPIVGIRR
jgi:hypothetical protein